MASKDYMRYVDECIERALVAAKFKFYTHENKGIANYESLERLLELLEGEVAELKEAIESGKKEHIQSECGDVVVYAALILDYIALKDKVVK